MGGPTPMGECDMSPVIMLRKITLDTSHISLLRVGGYTLTNSADDASVSG